MKRANLEEAWLVHRRPYGETSLILEFFSRQSGRIGLIAKGARTARRSGTMLAPFRAYLISYVGRGELPTLTRSEETGAALALAGEAMICGLYLNELLLRLLQRQDPHERLFDCYGATLLALSAATDSSPGSISASAVEIPLRLFEKDLLAEIGYGLVLDRCLPEGLAIEPDASYDYLPDRGPVGGTSVGSASDEGVRISGACLLALAQGDLSEAGVRRETKRLLRACLRPHLGERPLASRSLFSRRPECQST